MIANINIEDPIEISQRAAIEVVVELENGEKRWCFFFTPQAAALCGDWINGTKVNFHYNSPHMIIVSEISETIIHAAINDIESQGLIESCTKLV